jgi:hypothetical protein
VSFHGDLSSGGVRLQGGCDPVNSIPPIRSEIGAIELEEHVGQIDRHPASGLARLDVLPLELIEERSVAGDLGALLLDFRLLFLLLLLLRLELITDERAGAEPEGATDCRSGSRPADGAANNAAGCGATERADPCGFLARGKRSRATCGEEQGETKSAAAAPARGDVAHHEPGNGSSGLVFSLFLQAFELSSLPFKLGLVLFDLALLFLLSLVLPLELIANQRTGAEPEGATDCRSGSRPADGAADDAANRRTTERSDPRPFFSGGERGRATQRARHEHEDGKTDQKALHSSSFIYLLPPYTGFARLDASWLESFTSGPKGSKFRVLSVRAET